MSELDWDRNKIASLCRDVVFFSRMRLCIGFFLFLAAFQGGGIDNPSRIVIGTIAVNDVWHVSNILTLLLALVVGVFSTLIMRTLIQTFITVIDDPKKMAQKIRNYGFHTVLVAVSVLIGNGMLVVGGVLMREFIAGDSSLHVDTFAFGTHVMYPTVVIACVLADITIWRSQIRDFKRLAIALSR